MSIDTQTITPIDVDPESGEQLHIRPLVMMGSTDDLPALDPHGLTQLCAAADKVRTYNKRNMPFRQKLKFLWLIFLELFFTRTPQRVLSSDPFRIVVEEWYLKQTPPLTLKQKCSLFYTRVKEFFVYVPIPKGYNYFTGGR